MGFFRTLFNSFLILLLLAMIGLFSLMFIAVYLIIGFTEQVHFIGKVVLITLMGTLSMVTLNKLKYPPFKTEEESMEYNKEKARRRAINESWEEEEWKKHPFQTSLLRPLRSPYDEPRYRNV